MSTGLPSVIYLDNNATTLIDPSVAKAMHEVAQSRLANPASQHRMGRLARTVLENARDQIASLLGARTQGMAADRVILTSGGTEANCLAIRGLSAGRNGAIVISAIEHPSVLETAQVLGRQGRVIRVLPVDSHGLARLDILQGWLDASPQQPIALVSLMLANNETGVIQPVKQAALACHRAGVPMHTDAVQGVGKIDLSFAELEVDAMTVAPHKFHGPVGIGALMTRSQTDIQPLMQGGFQQLGLRPGTEPVVLAVGLARALALAMEGTPENARNMRALKDLFERRLQERLEGVHVLGHPTLRLPQTSSLAFQGTERQSLQMALDFAGVQCGTGSACASGSNQPSHVLQAMGIPKELVACAVRFSLSRETTDSEIEQAIDRIVETVCRIRRLGNAFAGESAGGAS
jgi:cysteine desulfurase